MTVAARARSRPGPRTGRIRRLVPGAAVLLGAVLPYLPLAGAGYVQDDHLAVEENAVVARGDPAEIFSTSYWEGAKGNDRSLYRPVPILTFAVERRLAGEPAPRLSHLVNVALHAGASLVLLALARRAGLGRAGALVAALLFAVQPVHSEAVANVVGRSEILAAIFSLGALLAASATGPWRRADGSAGPPPSARRARLAAWGAGALVFLALGSKEVAIAVLPLLLVQEALFRPWPREGGKGFWIDRAAAFAPVALAVEAYAILRIHALGAALLFQSVPVADNPLVALAPGARLFTALAIAARYAWRLVAGFPLAADYSGSVIRPEATLLAPRPLLGLALLLASLALALRPFLARAAAERGTARSFARSASFSAWVFLLPYLVVGNLLFLIGAGLAERLVYLPSAGFCLFVGALFARAIGAEESSAFPFGSTRARLTAAALATLGLAFGAMTWARTADWKSDRTIFEAAIRVNPESPRAQYILATLDDREGRPDLALPRLDTVLRLWPGHLAATVQKAALLGGKGDLKGAEAAARDAVRIDPMYALARFNLGVALHRQGRLAEAERELRRAVLLDPGLDSAWADLGHVRFEQRRYDEAAKAYTRAIALGRGYLRPRLQEALGHSSSSSDSSSPR